MNNPLPTYKVLSSYSIALFNDPITIYHLETGRLSVKLDDLCKIYGLDSSIQESKIMKHAILSKGLTLGDERKRGKSLFFGLSYLAMWLAFIDLHELTTQMDVEELILYQEEAMSVLEEAFCEGRLSDWPLISQCLNINMPIVQTYKETVSLLSIVKERMLSEAKTGALRALLEQST